MSATTFPRHLRPDNREAPAHVRFPAERYGQWGSPAVHANRCPNQHHDTACAIDARMIGGDLVRATGVRVAIATREMRGAV